MQTLSPPYDCVTRHGGLCFADITYLPLKVVEGAAEVKMIHEKCRESKQLPEFQPELPGMFMISRCICIRFGVQGEVWPCWMKGNMPYLMC